MNENRKSFFDRIVFLSFEDRLDVELAYSLAKYWFRDKFRMEYEIDLLGAGDKETRYFEHLRRVALILIDELKLVDPKMIIAALCHDALEDLKDDDFAAAQIEKRFGKDVIWIVKLLSKVPKEGYLERLVAFADWRVLMLKACDRLDNLRTIKFGTLIFQEKQIKETREKYFPVFDRMVEITPDEYKEKAKHLRDTIYNFVETYVLEKHPRSFSKEEYMSNSGHIWKHVEEYGSAYILNEAGKICMSLGRRNKHPVGDDV